MKIEEPSAKKTVAMTLKQGYHEMGESRECQKSIRFFIIPYSKIFVHMLYFENKPFCIILVYLGLLTLALFQEESVLESCML